MKVLRLILFLGLIAALTSCNNDKFSVVAQKSVVSDFESANNGWTGAMAEYTVKQSPTDTNFIKLKRLNLPSGLDTLRYGLVMVSINQSTSTFTYLKKQVSGLYPGRTYKVSFDIKLGTNITKGSELSTGTFLKVGAATVEPITDTTNHSFNIDKGKGGLDGKNLSVIGSISNDLTRTIYASVGRSSGSKSITVEADASGAIWLCVGIDSIYKGTILLYFDKITATINEI